MTLRHSKCCCGGGILQVYRARDGKSAAKAWMRHEMLKMCHSIEPIEATVTPELPSSMEETGKKCSHLSPPALWSSARVSHWLIYKKKAEGQGSRFTILGHTAGQSRIQDRFGFETTFSLLWSLLVLWFHVYVHSSTILSPTIFTCQAHV